MPFKKTNQRNLPQIAGVKRLFIGRTDYLSFFVNRILKPEDPSHNIISISGQGGVGKSTLLQRFLDEIHAPDFREYCFAALVNEQQATPASAMERIADQLKEQDHALKKFEEELIRYKEALRRMQAAGYYGEYEELTRDIIDTAGAIVEDIPFAGGIVHKGTSVISDIVLEKGRTHQFLKDAARLEDPIGDLTKAFVKDLNQQADALASMSGSWTKRACRIILIFDTFEKLAEDIAPWLLDHFLSADISMNVVLVVAGRDSIELSLPDDPKRWLPFMDSDTIHLMSLKAFTEEETLAYLQRRGITDLEKIRNVSELSKGLPLYLSMLTSNPEGRIDPNAEVVANFLRWIPKHEFQKRQLALNASLFSRPFTKDDFAAFSYPEPERTDLYHWIIMQPFIQSNLQDGRYTYHDLAKDLFCRYLYQRSRDDYYTARQALVHHYQQQLVALQSQRSRDVYTTRAWEELVFALIQQVFLLPDEESYLIGIEYVVRCHEHSLKADELIKVLRNLISREYSQLMTVDAQKIVMELLQYIEGYAENQYQNQVDAIRFILSYIDHVAPFPKAVIAYVYRHYGFAYRCVEDYQKSLEAYKHALTLAPDSSELYSGRGETYRKMGRYDKALRDFDRAIELDGRDARARAGRGQTNRVIKRYEEALRDLDQAIELDENLNWARVSRGQTYRLMKRYEEALQDFDRAIELDEKYVWARASRGETYRLMKRYDEAVQDLDRAIELDEGYAWAIASRGETNRLMKQYEYALRDFSRAIELDAKYTWAIASRGQTYRLMERYEEAVQDFSRAIELNEKYVWAIARRGQTYQLMEQHEEALQDFDRVLELDVTYIWAIVSRGETYRKLERYEEALRDFGQAIELNEKYAWSCRVSRGQIYRQMGRYEESLQDFDRLIELDKRNDFIWYSRALAHLVAHQMDDFHADMNQALAINQNRLNATLPQDKGYYHLRFNTALYLLVNGTILDAVDEYAKLLTTCFAVKQLKTAIHDLNEFLIIQPTNVPAQQILQQLETHMYSLKN